MEAIKKKMNAMKSEKDGALDKSEELSCKLRETEEAKAKVEEDLNTLQKKFSNLESDFDTSKEQLDEAQTKLEASEKRNTEEPVTPSMAHHNPKGTSKSYYLPPEARRRRAKSDKTAESKQQQTSPKSQSGSSKRTKDKKTKRKKRAKESSSECDSQSVPERRKERHRTKPKKERNKETVSSNVRPEPEGGNAVVDSIGPTSEFEKVIYSSEPLFSDLDITDADDFLSKNCDSKTCSGRSRQPGASMTASGVIMACPYLAINSNTMIKYSIISSELHSIVDCCRRVGRMP